MNLTPRGCSSIGGELASCMEECRNKTLRLFSSYGYNPFNPAEFQLLEGAMSNLARRRRERLMTINTPFGEPCCLRADITLSALSYMRLHHAPEEFPLRLCYAERIFSVPRAPKENLEDTQVGVELLGWEGLGSDVEVLALLLRALDSLGLNDSVVVLGDASIVPQLFSGLPGGLAGLLVDMLQDGRYFDYARTVESSDVLSLREKDILKELPSLKGPASILGRAEALLGSAGLLQALAEIVSSLTKLGYEDRLRVDLGFIRDLGYYSGPVFNVYATSNGPLLGGGGRYEGMLSETGFSCQSVGFGLSLRELALAREPREGAGKIMIWSGSFSSDRVLAYADSLDASSFSFEISWKRDEAESRRLALGRGCSWWVNLDGGYAEHLSSGKRIGTAEIGGVF